MNRVSAIPDEFETSSIEGKLSEIYPYINIENEIKALVKEGGWAAHTLWIDTGKKFGFLDKNGDPISDNLEKNRKYNELIEKWNTFVDEQQNVDKNFIQKILGSSKSDYAKVWREYIGI